MRKKSYEIHIRVFVPDTEDDDAYGYIRGELAMLRSSFKDMHVTAIKELKHKHGGLKNGKKRKTSES